jgi:hypothetical protein
MEIKNHVRAVSLLFEILQLFIQKSSLFDYIVTFSRNLLVAVIGPYMLMRTDYKGNRVETVCHFTIVMLFHRGLIRDERLRLILLAIQSG